MFRSLSKRVGNAFRRNETTNPTPEGQVQGHHNHPAGLGPQSKYTDRTDPPQSFGYLRNRGVPPGARRLSPTHGGPNSYDLLDEGDEYMLVDVHPVSSSELGPPPRDQPARHENRARPILPTTPPAQTANAATDGLTMIHVQQAAADAWGTRQTTNTIPRRPISNGLDGATANYITAYG